ncbi:MAG: hypothetical protein OHK0012_06960 [Synechococcales cyanobacterium]
MGRRVTLAPWQSGLVRRRLAELQVPVNWYDEELQLEVGDERGAVQLWSVVHQLSAPRAQLVAWLEACWRISAETAAQ